MGNKHLGRADTIKLAQDQRYDQGHGIARPSHENADFVDKSGQPEAKPCLIGS
jgi:hypothetical protein